ncbi:MAG: IS6 family transposase [Burkholderiaceae bacterium]
MRPKPLFKRHRFSPEVILRAVRWYCRFGLSYRDVRDLLAEQDVEVDASTVYRWVQKFGPEFARLTRKERNWRGLDWHMDETYIRVGGQWRNLWRAIDQSGQFVDCRLTARRDAGAARAFLGQAIRDSGLYYPQRITTDKALNYKKVIRERNYGVDRADRLVHVDRKYRNNRIESDHAALKKILRPMRGFKYLHSAKAALKGIEAVRTIRNGGVYNRPIGIQAEVRFINTMFGLANRTMT